jgi:hypothetical protein
MVMHLSKRQGLNFLVAPAVVPSYSNTLVQGVLSFLTLAVIILVGSQHSILIAYPVYLW